TGNSHSTGMGLVAAIFLITVVAMLTVAIMRSVRTSNDAYALDVIAHRAFSAAESGAQLGANRLFAPSGTGACSASQSYDFDELGLASCVASVSCQSQSVDGQPLYTIRSAGRCDSGGVVAEREVLVRMSP
ncbi:MAG: hypothetical protein AB8B93_02820, partial [Pseudomonadales bacterium]